MRRRAAQDGFSLVELMIATTVALFATLVIMQTFAVSEGYRRTATSGGDAGFSGAMGAYMLEGDLKTAGYGINSATYLGCLVNASDQGPPVRNFAFTLAPVQITPNAVGPDSITVEASSTDMMPGPISLSVSMTQATDNYTVTSAYGVNKSDVLLLAQGTTCSLAQATNTPWSASSNQNVIQHASGGAAGRYNPALGSGLYAANAVVIDLGPNPTVNTYYIQNNTLVVDQPVAGRLAQPVAANIVQLKALYGVDTNGDGVIDAWQNTAPASWGSVLAVRVALVARSAQPEKPANGATACNTTTASPIVVTWDDGSTTNVDISGTAPTGPAWQCYRYRTFHLTSSLRNLIWTPS